MLPIPNCRSSVEESFSGLYECSQDFRHVIKFLGLSTLFEIVGSSVQGFSAKSLLIALPPALAFAAVVNWALSPAVPLSFRGVPDEEHSIGISSQANVHDAEEPASRSNLTRVGRVSRRNSNNHQAALPDPSNFDDVDLESLQSDHFTIGSDT
jgi:hypothetical protein